MDTMVPVFFTQVDGRFVPSDYARGPFIGLQGGGVAAIVAGRIEKAATSDGMPAAVFAHFLRPVVPVSALEVQVQCVRPGLRVSIWEGSLRDRAKEFARVRVTFIQLQPIASLDLATTQRTPEAPESLPVQQWKLTQAKPWLMDTMDVRGPADGIYWMRMKRPLFEDPTVLSWILRTLAGWPAPIRALPNPDLALHLLRPPQSRWLGVRPSSMHGASGTGVCQATLLDQRGVLGSVSMSIAIA